MTDSNAEASAKMMPSSNGAATSCAPTGRPPDVRPAGTDKVGKPIMLQGMQFLERIVSYGSVSSALTAGTKVVGMMKASNPCSSANIRSWNSDRNRWAVR